MKLKDREHPKGRKPVLSNIEAATCAILKQRQNIATKKSLWEILEPSLSYRKFVDALNRAAPYLARIIAALLTLARVNPHLVKLTDWTDIPVCLTKNAKRHKTMRGLAAWSKTGKGSFFGLKLHLSADLAGRVLALKFTPGNSDDRCIFRKMNEKLKGLFIADAGYVSRKPERDFFIEHQRMLITATRKNMKKIATPVHIALLNLRMRVEIHFRILKLCYGLVTSFPRSIDGYLTHYLSSICAYLIV
ncbi:MAG: transposase [Candidatus Sungbacteria bacterium]|nr:transposase [Candidatus Sungbacteria bacterium]